MSQLNINLTPAFEEKLRYFMRIRGIPNKSEAIRVAVEESLQRELRQGALCDFSFWLGRGLGPGENEHPRFPSDDAMWESESHGR